MLSRCNRTVKSFIVIQGHRCHAPDSGIHYAPSSKPRRSLQTAVASGHTQQTPTQPQEPLTHFRITLRRSAIGLPKNIRATLEALGIHRRMQTVFHAHMPDIAGKILNVKELVEVTNVPASEVRTKTEMRRGRRPARGYEVVRRFGESGESLG